MNQSQMENPNWVVRASATLRQKLAFISCTIIWITILFEKNFFADPCVPRSDEYLTVACCRLAPATGFSSVLVLLFLPGPESAAESAESAAGVERSSQERHVAHARTPAR
jgi:hypothetical protein